MTRLIFVLGLMGSLASAAQAEGVENLPAAIGIKGSVPLAQLQAAGAQIYICAKNTAGALNWTFREPLATLLEGGRQWDVILSAQRGNSSMGREWWANS